MPYPRSHSAHFFELATFASFIWTIDGFCGKRQVLHNIIVSKLNVIKVYVTGRQKNKSANIAQRSQQISQPSFYDFFSAAYSIAKSYFGCNVKTNSFFCSMKPNHRAMDHNLSISMTCLEKLSLLVVIIILLFYKYCSSPRNISKTSFNKFEA